MTIYGSALLNTIFGRPPWAGWRSCTTSPIIHCEVVMVSEDRGGI